MSGPSKQVAPRVTRRAVDRWDRLGRSRFADRPWLDRMLAWIAPGVLIGGGLLAAIWLSFPMWGPTAGPDRLQLDWSRVRDQLTTGDSGLAIDGRLHPIELWRVPRDAGRAWRTAYRAAEDGRWEEAAEIFDRLAARRSRYASFARLNAAISDARRGDVGRARLKLEELWQDRRQLGDTLKIATRHAMARTALLQAAQEPRATTPGRCLCCEGLQYARNTVGLYDDLSNRRDHAQALARRPRAWNTLLHAYLECDDAFRSGAYAENVRQKTGIETPDLDFRREVAESNYEFNDYRAEIDACLAGDPPPGNSSAACWVFTNVGAFIGKDRSFRLAEHPRMAWAVIEASRVLTSTVGGPAPSAEVDAGRFSRLACEGAGPGSPAAESLRAICRQGLIGDSAVARALGDGDLASQERVYRDTDATRRDDLAELLQAAWLTQIRLWFADGSERAAIVRARQLREADVAFLSGDGWEADRRRIVAELVGTTGRWRWTGGSLAIGLLLGALVALVHRSIVRPYLAYTRPAYYLEYTQRREFYRDPAHLTAFTEEQHR